MWQILHHAASVCVLTQPIRFETENGSSFARPLPTPMCLVSFGADLAPGASNCVNNVSLIRLHSFEARVINVLEKMRTYTGNRCESIASPLRSDALQDAERNCAALLPARITNTNVKEILSKAHHIAFISPPLAGKGKRRCVEGSVIAFFNEYPSNFLHRTSARPIRFSMLNPQASAACLKYSNFCMSKQ
jgi:hypothetical protein